LSGETAYDELDINDYPGEARLRATNRDVLLRVQEETGAALINRGVFVAPGTQPPPGQRRLYLAIEGQDARAVALAKAEMKRVLNEETLNLAAGGSRSQSAMANYGKYSLV
jgi:ATP-dependent RNA helicase DDX46/PRP5